MSSEVLTVLECINGLFPYQDSSSWVNPIDSAVQ